MTQPLVSVCIITYKSSATVISTLESIKAQTYQNLELIISDDGSPDDTCQVIQNWLNENKGRFTNAQLVTVEKNTGVALNLDRSIKASRGEWIKILAGDDQLKPECIETFVKYTQNSSHQFYSCDMELFCEDGAVPEKTKANYRFFFSETSKSLKHKQRHIRTYFDYPGPAWFFSHQLYNEVNGVDPDYTMMDEYPFLFKTLKAGYDIIPVKEKLVLYRVGNASLSHTSNPLGNEVIYRQNKAFFYNVRIHELRKHFMPLEIWDQKLYYFCMDRQFEIFHKTGKISRFYFILHKLNVIYIIRKLTGLKYKKEK